MVIQKTLFAATALLTLSAAALASQPSIDLGKLATVHERYQDYNVEMDEVIGGRFWVPYGGPADAFYAVPGVNNPA